MNDTFPEPEDIVYDNTQMRITRCDPDRYRLYVFLNSEWRDIRYFGDKDSAVKYYNLEFGG